MKRAKPGELVQHERQDCDRRQQFGDAQRNGHGARRRAVQQLAVGQLMKQARHGAQDRHGAQQFEHQTTAPRGHPRGMVGARLVRLRTDEQASHDGGRAGQHQQLHRDAKAGGLAHLEQQQRQKAGRVDHDAGQLGPDAHVTLRRQDGKGEPVGSDGRSFLRHDGSSDQLNE